MIKEKTVACSKSVLSDIMLPNQANPAGNVHGGEIMKIMDNCGSVAAMRHAKTNIVTVKVDELIFYNPIYVGQLVICEAQLVYAGKTSMDVKVTVKVEDMQEDTEPKIALSAYFTFVALDKLGKPCIVPALKPETEEELKLFEIGRKRYLQSKQK